MATEQQLLQRLEAAFPGRETITKSEAAAWLGISQKTLKKKYKLPPGNNTKRQIAKAVSNER